MATRDSFATAFAEDDYEILTDRFGYRVSEKMTVEEAQTWLSNFRRGFHWTSTSKREDDMTTRVDTAGHDVPGKQVVHNGNTYDLVQSDKPTYYYNANGVEVSYLEHAQFIADNSFSVQSPNGYEIWHYPMLDRRDFGMWYVIILNITHYEHKPRYLGRMSLS